MGNEARTYRFYKETNEWFIDLPDYIKSGGSRDELQMVEGADTMLDIISKDSENVYLTISTERFEQADQLILTEVCSALKGGGIYFMEEFEGNEVGLRIWLCRVIEFVFGKIPVNLFVKRQQNRE